MMSPPCVTEEEESYDSYEEKDGLSLLGQSTLVRRGDFERDPEKRKFLSFRHILF